MQNDKCKSQNANSIRDNGKGPRPSYDLSERLLEFAARIGRVVDALPETRMGRHIANQLVRSGTSPAPNYEEGCSAESRRDFVHKLSICLKELRESRCWLRMIVRTELLPQQRLAEVADEADQLCRVIAQSIVTAKRNNGRKTAAPLNEDPLVGQPLSEIEKHYIECTLEVVTGNVRKAAVVLGIDESTLNRKMQQYRLNGQPKE